MGVQNLTGQTLGQYELRELLGVGGMGAVYRGYQATLKRYVAVKVISANLAEQPGYMERFTREAETSAGLQHPHIIKVFDYGLQGGISYIVLELLNGGTLAERIAQRAGTTTPLPSLGEVAEMLKDVGSALDYAHGRGVVHRDIKPSNVMFDDQGNAYLVDFGIAKLVAATHGLTETGKVIGTWGYMAPEQWRAGELSAATDQYALGIMTYALVTGHMPFEAETPANIMHKHLNEMPPPPTAYRPDVPDALTHVIDRALAKSPRERFPACTAFAQAFDGAIRGHTGPKTAFFTLPVQRKPAVTSRIFTPSGGRAAGSVTGARPLHRHPVLWLALIMIIALAGALLLTTLGGGEDDPTSRGEDRATETPTVADIPPTGIVLVPSVTPAPENTAAPTNTAIPTDTATAPATDTRALTDTPRPTNTPPVLATLTPTVPIQTQVWLDLSATAALWTPTPTEDFQATIDAQVTALYAQ